MVRGSCLCGSVAFEIEDAIHDARFCHCTNCRKFSGAPFAAWGLIETRNLRLSPPDPGVTKYDSGGGLRVFCSMCGSPLWYEPADMPHYRGIPLGVVDDGEVPAPAMHVWLRSKVAWMSIADALPKHETYPRR